MAFGSAGATSAISDEWSSFNNPGGLGSQSGLKFSISGQAPFLIPEYSTLQFSGLRSTKVGTFSLSFEKGPRAAIGIDRMILSYGYGAQTYSFGAGFQLFQYDFGEYGTRLVPVIDVGGIIKVVPNLDFGITFFNPAVSSLRIDGEKRTLPIMVRSGISFKPNNWINLLAEIRKEIQIDPSLNLGVNLFPSKIFEIYLGSVPAQSMLSSGFSVKSKGWKFGFSSRIQRELGLSLGISFSYFPSNE